MTVSIAGQDAASLGGRRSILCRQRRDHAELDAMMDRYRSGGMAGTERDALWLDIVQLVFSHAFAEETVLWPILRRVHPAGEELTEQVEQEHQAINELIARVERTPGDPRRAGWIEEAFVLISQDIRDEEDELLPCLKDAFSDRRLRSIGAAWEAVRATAPTRPHPAVSRRPPGNALSGVPLSVFDRLRDLSPVASPAARRTTVLLAGMAAAAGCSAVARRAVRRRHPAGRPRRARRASRDLALHPLGRAMTAGRLRKPGASR
ncbi:hemerythrin domain-containing protein [Streptomyces sp. NPDC016675]|uniref:hemerythrin domain-containing protein n=1 Tax=Streptomyces sp. NPDC016675 TaxID=3364970 RepID=UPI0036F96E4D